MKGQWKEVVRLAFKGERFRDHALDLSAVAELGNFQRLVAETAKALWRAENPDRERLPRRFEERTRLCLRKIEEGSAVVPLEVFEEGPEQFAVFETEPAEVGKAIDLAYRVIRSAERDELIPDDFPKALLPEYERWGQGLADNEEIEVVVAGKEPAHVTPVVRKRLSFFRETPQPGSVDLTGEVLEADVRQGRFQVWLDEKTWVSVTFRPDHEEQVTTALRDHKTLRVRVVGIGETNPQGKPMRITEVTDFHLFPAGSVPYDSSAPAIEDVLAELASEVPREEWDKLPSDLTDNLDHYLYGTPRG